VALVLLALLFTTPVLAQEPIIEYGSPGELVGVKSIFIYTGVDLKAHNEIAEHVVKKLPGLRLVDRPLDADVVLAFVQDESAYLATILRSGNSRGTLTTNGMDRGAEIEPLAVVLRQSLALRCRNPGGCNSGKDNGNVSLQA
jgi:hypothetical protein